MDNDYATGDGFEIFLELGITHFMNNKETLKKDLENAKLAIFDEYPQIIEKEIEILKNPEVNVEGRPSKEDRVKIRIVTEVFDEIGGEYRGRVPKNILINEMSERNNINEEMAEEIIRILKRKGIIFEPQQGYLKVV